MHLRSSLCSPLDGDSAFGQGRGEVFVVHLCLLGSHLRTPTLDEDIRADSKPDPYLLQREYTIHLHKRVHNTQFKKRAPTGVKEVIKFAQKAMGTKEVRVDPKLNQEIWKLGVKDVPRRVRVRLESEYLLTASATAT